MPRPDLSRWLGPAIAVAAAVLVGNLLILAVGQQPLHVWRLLFAVESGGHR